MMTFPRLVHVAAVLGAAFATAQPGMAQDRSWLVAGTLTAGNAWATGSSMYGSWGAAVEAEGPEWAPRFTFERVGLGRTCKTSLPPQCDIDVPGGRLLLFGLSRTLASPGSATLLVRPETGAAFWTTNAQDGTFLEFVAGGSAELRITVGNGAVFVGGAVRSSHAAAILGGFAGLAIRL